MFDVVALREQRARVERGCCCSLGAMALLPWLRLGNTLAVQPSTADMGQVNSVAKLFSMLIFFLSFLYLEKYTIVIALYSTVSITVGLHFWTQAANEQNELMFKMHGLTSRNSQNKDLCLVTAQIPALFCLVTLCIPWLHWWQLWWHCEVPWDQLLKNAISEMLLNNPTKASLPLCEGEQFVLCLVRGCWGVSSGLQLS